MDEISSGSPPTAADERACKNCGTPLQGPYCGLCGQHERQGRPLSFRAWSSEGVETVANLDWRFGRTVLALTVAPGKTIRSWVDGQRIRYTSPVRYVFLTCALWWAMHALLTDKDVVRQELGRAGALIFEYGQVINLVLVPLLGVAAHVAFLGTKARMAESVCVALYGFGHVFLFRAILVVIANLAHVPGTVANYADQAFFPVYLLWTYLTFYPRGKSVLVHVLRALGALFAVVLASTLAVKTLTKVLVELVPETTVPAASAQGQQAGETVPEDE